MTNKTESSNSFTKSAGIAELSINKDVASSITKLNYRRRGVPGLGVLYGASGTGKSVATNFYANAHNAIYIQMASVWRSKELVTRILKEMGVAYSSSNTTSELLDMVITHLSGAERTLIIDEFDHAAKHDTLIELVRDIYESAQCSILLVGEELLPRKLEKWERFYSRISVWIPAPAVSIEDVKKLADIYSEGVKMNDEVIHYLADLAQGSARRVINYFAAIQEASCIYDIEIFTLDDVKQHVHLPTHRAPSRRA